MSFWLNVSKADLKIKSQQERKHIKKKRFSKVMYMFIKGAAK